MSILENLPPILAGGAQRIAQATQAPVELCAMSVLGASALVVQGHYNVGMGSIVQPTSLYLLTIARSGERKTSVDGFAMRAVDSYQKSERMQYEQQKLRASDDENIALPTKYVVQDPTVPGLLKAAEHQAVMGVFTTEGAGFFGGYSMQKDNLAHSLAIYSQLWDGGSVGMTRSGYAGGASELYDRRLSMHLQIQPNFLVDILGSQVMAEQGFLGRFLISYPETTIGTRFFCDFDINSCPDYQRYLNAHNRLLEKKPVINRLGGVEPRVLFPDEDAKKIWIDFYNQIEVELKPDTGRYHRIASLAAKAASQALRLAGIFEAIETVEPQHISTASMTSAIKLESHVMDTYLRLSQQSQLSPDEHMAEMVLAWIAERGFEFVYGSLEANTRPNAFRKAGVFQKALKTLCYMQRLQLMPQKEIDGAMRKQVYKVLSTKSLVETI